ncbi:hypothetical protein JOF41_001477 [Saccharothrix coeruleofusca]|nr:hypothetical protein [Saccharothrix coeruleofusca]
MAPPKNYPDELRERALRMATDYRIHTPLSTNHRYYLTTVPRPVTTTGV